MTTRASHPGGSPGHTRAQLIPRRRHRRGQTSASRCVEHRVSHALIGPAIDVCSVVTKTARLRVTFRPPGEADQASARGDWPRPRSSGRPPTPIRRQLVKETRSLGTCDADGLRVTATRRIGRAAGRAEACVGVSPQPSTGLTREDHPHAPLRLRYPSPPFHPTAGHRAVSETTSASSRRADVGGTDSRGTIGRCAGSGIVRLIGVVAWRWSTHLVRDVVHQG